MVSNKTDQKQMHTFINTKININDEDDFSYVSNTFKNKTIDAHPDLSCIDFYRNVPNLLKP